MKRHKGFIMKSLAFFALIIISFNVLGCNEKPGSAPPASIKTISYIKMNDAKIGWALSNTAVLKTLDGGAHWTDISPSMISAGSDVSGCFLSQSTGWVAVHAQNDSKTTVFRTGDSGGTWSQSTIQEALLSTFINFIDPMHGWLLGCKGAAAGSNPVAVYRTGDGGRTWTLTSSDLPVGGPKNGISFKDASAGWITGQQPTGKPVYYITKNGGEAWVTGSLKMPVPENQNTFATTYPPVFFDEARGILPADYGCASVIYNTEDGGENWTASTPVNTHANVFFALPRDYWVSNGKAVYESKDNGKSWTEINKEIAGDDIYQMDFINDKVGWAVGQSLYKTIDGGVSWNKIQ